MRVLQGAGVINSNGLLARTKVSARLIIDGVELITYGYAIVKSVTESDFEIILFFGNTEFFSKLGDKKLNELEDTSLDHDWRWTNILASSLDGNQFSKDYIYPLIEWGDDDQSLLESGSSAEVNVEYLLPVISADYLLEKIVEEAGFTLDFTKQAIQEKIYIPIVDLLPNDTTKEQVNASASESTDTQNIYAYPLSVLGFAGVYMNTYSDDSPISGQSMKVLEFDLEGEDPVETHSYLGIRIGCAGTYKIVVGIGLLGSPSSDEFKISIVKHWGTIASYEDGYYYSEYTVLDSFNLDFLSGAPNDSLTITEDFLIGDYVSVIIERVSGTSTPYFDSTYTLFGIVSDVLSIPEVTLKQVGYGYRLPISKNLPPIKQSDFIKDICLRGCYNLEVDYKNKKVKLYPFSEISSNLGNSFDWSNKSYDPSSEKFSYALQSYGKINNIKNASDSEVEEGYGDASFDLENESLNDSVDIYTSPFASSEMVGRTFGNILMARIKFLTISNEKEYSFEPRILLVEEYTSDNVLTYTSEQSGGTVYYYDTTCVRAYFYDEDEAYNLDWNTLLDLHYDEFIAMLKVFTKLSLSLFVDQGDLANLDFKRPIWIKRYESYFYINLIKDFLGSDSLTTVELVKLF